MKKERHPELVRLENFIVATRDSGYKNTASALAELVDNSIDAGATEVVIELAKAYGEYSLKIIDNGSGMTEAELEQALQFGGSSKFNNRSQLGRYGMGLPNASLSQAKRIQVVSWKGQQAFSQTIDQIIERSKKLRFNKTNIENIEAKESRFKIYSDECKGLYVDVFPSGKKT